MPKVILLEDDQVKKKITRMAYEIWERNYDEENLLILGIKKSGMALAELIFKELKKISDINIGYGTIAINKKDVLKEIVISNESNLDFNNVLIVDDVANSGKTLLYALTPILKYTPKKIEIAVLINRKHKLFPIKPDVIGTEMSTTLQDNIEVKVNQNGKITVFLE